MMYLTPPDTELTWEQVEPQFRAMPEEALKIWRDARILMPDDAADGLALDEMERFFTATAEAVGLPLLEVYPARYRIRWLNFTDTPGEPVCFASLDGGPPRQMKNQHP